MVSGLTEALIAKQEVEVPGGGKFAVRGLSPTDVFAIYRNHTGEMGAWFEKLRAGEAELSLNAAPQLATSLLDTAPQLAAELIAAGAGDGNGAPEPEMVAIARRLPISAQASALQKIAGLTFTQEMPPKKLLEIVVQMARSLSGPETSET